MFSKELIEGLKINNNEDSIYRLLPYEEAKKLTKNKHLEYDKELREDIDKKVPELIYKDAKRGKYSTTYYISQFYADNENVVIKILKEKKNELLKLGYDVSFEIKDYNGTYKQASLNINWRI